MDLCQVQVFHNLQFQQLILIGAWEYISMVISKLKFDLGNNIHLIMVVSTCFFNT